MKSDIRKQASELFNSMPESERKKAGLGYSLAQLNTIAQQRQANKEMVQREDERLSAWQKNIELHVNKEYLTEVQEGASKPL